MSADDWLLIFMVPINGWDGVGDNIVWDLLEDKELK